MASMVRIIESDETKLAVQEILDLVKVCIGPNGRFKVLQAKTGGYAMITTTSSKIFDFFYSSNAVAQVILSGFKSHLHVFKDGGLFLAALTTSLFLEHLQSNLPLSLCVTANNYMLERITAWLKNQNLAMTADVGKLDDMMKFIGSIVASKPVCQLSSKEVNHLSLNILKAFFGNLVENHCGIDKNGINLVLNEGLSVMESFVFPGFAIRLTAMDAANNRLHLLLNGSVTSIVFATSLAGDQSIVDSLITQGPANKAVVDGITYDQLLSLGGSVIASGVRLVFCQKVVHPSLRRHLETKGVIVIDRLGYQATTALCNVVQVKTVDSPFDQLTEANIGYIREIYVQEFLGKRYIVVQPSSQRKVHTMMLCGKDENTLEELKAVILSAEKSLFNLVQDPKVVCGGGCFETQIASFVRSLAEEDLKLLFCTRYKASNEEDWRNALKSIAKSFERVACCLHETNGDCYVDNTVRHLWCFPANSEPSCVTDENYCCCCCSVKYSKEMKFRNLKYEKATINQEKESKKDAMSERVAICFPDIVDSLFLRSKCIASAFELCNIILRVGLTLEHSSGNVS